MKSSAKPNPADKARTVLVLYVPALHSSYVQLFEKYPHADALYILDQTIIDQFPRMKREIRAIHPVKMQQLLSKSSYFPEVWLANEATLKDLAADDAITIILSDEQISDWLAEQYFVGKEIIREPLFLRFDEKTVQAARQEIPFSGTITENQFHQQLMDAASQEAEKSSDWFLRVGAALISDDYVVELAHNTRMPADHSLWTIGDPRNYMEYGTDTHQRTTLHAEQALIAHCANRGLKTQGAAMYVTAFPCPDCVNNIAEAGIIKLYFKEGFSQLSSTEVFEVYGIEIIQVKK